MRGGKAQTTRLGRQREDGNGQCENLYTLCGGWQEPGNQLAVISRLEGRQH